MRNRKCLKREQSVYQYMRHRNDENSREFRERLWQYNSLVSSELSPHVLILFTFQF